MRGKTSATKAMSWVLDDERVSHRRQQPDQFAPTARIETGSGLVEDEDLRIHRQHGRYRDSLTLSERQPVGHAPFGAGHAYGGQCPINPLVDLGGLDTHVQRAEGDVLIDRRAE